MILPNVAPKLAMSVERGGAGGKLFVAQVKRTSKSLEFYCIDFYLLNLTVLDSLPKKQLDYKKCSYLISSVPG